MLLNKRHYRYRVQDRVYIQENESKTDQEDEDDEFDIIDRDETIPSQQLNNVIITNKQCPICEQEFNQMKWKYKCVKCDKHHCSLCAPIRDNNDNDNDNDKRCRICHVCYQ